MKRHTKIERGSRVLNIQTSIQERIDQELNVRFKTTLVIVVGARITTEIEHSWREIPGRHIFRARDFFMSKPNVNNKVLIPRL
jgi:hypothetical protein